ncbi:unnamed protein product [Rotaria sp. Silwood1]|nr:unnamed protein product [Rotaria sp. Silwood1]CAF4824267.1 unnamed protein product [Rotaria sp. Silwood1]
MQSAIEKLREYRDTGCRSSDEVIKLWTNVLSKCNLSILGDEKWLVVEQVFKSSLLCSNSLIAHDCLQQMNEHFQTTSPASIALNAMYFEFIGEFDKAKQTISTLFDDNETNGFKKSINLINFLVIVKKMTEAIINNSALNELTKSLNEIKNLLKSINLNDALKDKINLIINNIDYYFLHLSYDMKKMNSEIEFLKNEFKYQDCILNELEEEIVNLKKQESKKVLDEAYVHLLIPFTIKYEEEFEKSNQSQTNTKQSAFYHYKSKLKELKSAGESSENSLKILNKVINEFINQADIPKEDFIDLLINKSDHNHHAHIIDDYIEDLMNNQSTENIINYLENEHSMKLIVDSNDEIYLNKLIKLNIAIKRKEKSLNIFLDRYFDIQRDPNYMIGGPFRMPIVEKYKEMGTIITGKIESGRVHVGDRYVIMPNRTHVQVTNIYSGDREINWSVYGQHKISRGFILCDAQQKCRVGRVFDAQVKLTKNKSNIRPGYSAVLHIHAAVAEVQLKELLALIDRKTGETTREYPKFLKQNQIVTARFELSQRGQIICMELFEHFPRLGRFTLLDEDRIVAVGKVLQIVG